MKIRNLSIQFNFDKLDKLNKNVRKYASVNGENTCVSDNVRDFCYILGDF